MPLTNCPCGCGWTKHVIFNRFSVAELDARVFKNESRRVYVRARAHGQIQPAGLCESCGEAKPLDGHHEDYSKPLEVVWLCRPCHHAADKVRRAREFTESRRDLAA